MEYKLNFMDLKEGKKYLLEKPRSEMEYVFLVTGKVMYRYNGGNFLIIPYQSDRFAEILPPKIKKTRELWINVYKYSQYTYESELDAKMCATPETLIKTEKVTIEYEVESEN